MSRQVKQFKIRPLSLMLSARYHQVLSVMMISSFFLILGGLEPILAHAFSIEIPERAQSLEIVTNQVQEKNQHLDSKIVDYTDIVQTIDLNCLSDQIQKNNFKVNSVISNNWTVGLSITTLQPFEEEIKPTQALTTTQEQIVISNKSSDSQTKMVITQPHATLLEMNSTIALVGPQIQRANNHQVKDKLFDQHLVCTTHDQPQELRLKTHQDKQFSVLAGLPDYLKQAINGGLSKARFKAQVDRPLQVIELGVPTKPKKIANNYQSLSVHNTVATIERVNYQSVICHNIKSPTMSTGPPLSKVSIQTFKPMSQPSLDQLPNPSCKQSKQLIFNINKNNFVSTSLSKQDNLLTIIIITG